MEMDGKGKQAVLKKWRGEIRNGKYPLDTVQSAIDKLVHHSTGHEVSHEIRAIWDWQNERFMRWADKIRTHMEMARKR